MAPDSHFKAAVPGLRAAQGRMAGTMGGMSGMMGGAGGPSHRFGLPADQFAVGGRMLAEEGRAAGAPGSGATVRQIGSKTFYFKDGRWVDSSLKPGDETKAEQIVQFSDAYFRLARAQKAEYNQYFSQAEPVTVKLEDRVYQIDPAPPEKSP
jgi:Ca-activated chloride channel family protein